MPTLRRLLPLTLLVLFGACASHESFQVRVLRPAPVDLGQFELIAVDRFSGSQSEQFQRNFTDHLETARNPMTGEQFEIMDRDEVDRVLDDLRRRSGSGLDEHAMAVLERWRSAEVMLRGRVQEYSITEDLVETETVDRQGQVGMLYQRVVAARVRADIEVLDGPGERLFDRAEFDEVASRTTQALDAEPEPIDGEALLARAEQKLFQRYLQRILPHYQYVSVRLFTDGDLPDLEIGNGYARSGNWQAAGDSYQRALTMAQGELAEVRHKAFFNLGMAQMFRNSFDAARSAFQEAYAASGDRSMLAELNSVDAREQDYLALQEQAGRVAEPGR